MKNFLLLILSGSVYAGVYFVIFKIIRFVASTNIYYDLTESKIIAYILTFILMGILASIPYFAGLVPSTFANRIYPFVVFSVLVTIFCVFIGVANLLIYSDMISYGLASGLPFFFQSIFNIIGIVNGVKGHYNEEFEMKKRMDDFNLS